MSSPIKPSGKHPRGADRPRLFDDDDDIETRVAERPEDEPAQATSPEARPRMPSASKKGQATRTGSASSGSGGSRSLPSLSDVSGPVMGLRGESKGRDDGQRMREVMTREDQPDPNYTTVPKGLERELPSNNATMPDSSARSLARSG